MPICSDTITEDNETTPNDESNVTDDTTTTDCVEADFPGNTLPVCSDVN